MTTRHTLALLIAIVGLGCSQEHTSGTTDGGMLGIDGGGVSVDGGAPLDGGSAPDSGLADAGPPPPTRCDGLAPAACLAALCVPMFDDACCPACSPGEGCADCTRPEYLGCMTEEASSCRGGPACGTAPAWACGPVGADCTGAHAVALDTCDRTACVPSYPSGAGEPDLATATCVPIVGSSCTVACRRIAPECPTGTTPEGDGFCYTDRCIPAFVCL